MGGGPATLRRAGPHRRARVLVHSENAFGAFLISARYHRRVSTTPLKGERVLLRAVEAADQPVLVALFAETEVARWWWGYGAERVEREFLGDDDPETIVYAIDVEGAVAGVIQYSEETEPEYRRASIDIAVGTAWHGTGVAVDSLRTLARYLIDELGHHHLTIDPAADNGRAIACYAKIGFKPVGILRQNERGSDGTFHDSMLMDLVADELL